jgi:hypothetical protein
VIKHLLGWVERRRRVFEELRFHAELLEQEFIALGCDRKAARHLAKRRLGSIRKHRRRAFRELGATFRDLTVGLAEERSETKWLTPIALGICSLVLQAIIRPDVAMVVSWMIWSIALCCLLPIEAVRWVRQVNHWRYHLYSVTTLMTTALLGNVAWMCLIMIWRLPLWPTQGWSVAVFSAEIVGYLLGCCVFLRVWSGNRAGRCRRCASRLRLPDESGRSGSLLIHATTRSSICIHGHGTLTADYWHSDWRGCGAFWDEIFKPSRA